MRYSLNQIRMWVTWTTFNMKDMMSFTKFIYFIIIIVQSFIGKKYPRKPKIYTKLFSNLYTNNITDMSYMFSGFSLLKVLKLYNFNIKNVINMRSMFSECSDDFTINILTH